ncbi:Succinate dehydrogenase subunit 5 like [Actinidia chinensis var. chinensis]|uniref:Succinate dehydrogenase subunit 5 like n=1 Tax=Actinidia chinensis var. chinensis TaxID=1590841 RepID=A0A2R6Q043_ACTCC|nr:Succinate dehydrogenase subunit 5 like [Actinidia chinensis var. chinensis]
MSKMATMRSLYRSICLRSLCSAAAAATTNHQHLRRGFRCFHLSPEPLPLPPKRLPSDCQPPFAYIGSTRSFSNDVAHLPDIKDPEILIVFKDLMAASWDEIPDTVVHDANKALSKNTDDKAGQEALANIFRAAEAAEEFGGMLVSLRMAIDDSIGLSGENVKPLSDEFVNALRTAYQRYTAYLDAFGPDESYLHKKVETELGTKMIHLKMRCSGIGSEWGKITVLGTSGLSGSYVEHRA